MSPTQKNNYNFFYQNIVVVWGQFKGVEMRDKETLLAFISFIF